MDIVEKSPRPEQFYNFVKADRIYNDKKGRLFNHEYDEPTYISVRVNFFPTTYSENIAYTNGDVNDSRSYNEMPHPLLSKTGLYSTVKYLRDNLGDEYRAKLLEQFINGIVDLNFDCPYYIKSVTGLNELLKVDPKRGSRVIKDGIITLKCIEGLDMRINALLNIYKKVAWDDVYQRWILPDMMRFFKMTILVSEFRLFGNFKKNNLTSNYTPGDINSDINLKIPTIKYECQMCEFDISDTIAHFNQLNVDKINEPLNDIEIKIKVGNVIEYDTYDLFTNSIDINDLIISRYQRIQNVDVPRNDKGKILFNERFGSLYDTVSHKLNNTIDAIDVSDLYHKVSNSMATDKLLNITRSSTYLDKLLSGTLSNYVSRTSNYITDEIRSFVHTDDFGINLTTADIISSFSVNNIEGIIDNLRNRSNDVSDLYPEVSNSMATNKSLNITLFEDALKDIVNSGATTKSGQDFITGINNILGNNYTTIDAEINDIKAFINEYKTTVSETPNSMATNTEIKHIL